MTRLLEILISLAIVLGLFVLVALVLPSKRHLVEKVETNRKLTIVFDSLNSLRRFDDWNPLVLRDPRMQLSYSGPASGVMAAAFTGRKAGFPNLVTYDMGGTSTDVALIRGAQPAVSNEIEVEHAMPIHVPMVDVHTIGAGGGSIAFINDAGLLQVGPESAGANPGPMCYGRGGNRVTITDGEKKPVEAKAVKDVPEEYRRVVEGLLGQIGVGK